MAKKKALKNHSSGLSRVYVICIANTRRVIGYYCLSTGSIQRNLAPEPCDVMLPNRCLLSY